MKSTSLSIHPINPFIKMKPVEADKLQIYNPNKKQIKDAFSSATTTSRTNHIEILQDLASHLKIDNYNPDY